MPQYDGAVVIGRKRKLRDVTNKMDDLGDSIKNAGQQTITFGDLLKANLLSDYIQKGISKLADDEEKKLLDKQNKIVEDGLSEILKTYEKAFDDLEKKRESYRKKLMSVGGDLFSIDVTKDKNGKETTAHTVNNINEQLKKMREFHSQITKLKNQGASEALLSELFALDDKDAAQFAKYLSGMSSAEFAKVNELYNKKQKLIDVLEQLKNKEK